MRGICTDKIIFSSFFSFCLSFFSFCLFLFCLQSEDCKILWDFYIQTDKTLQHDRPDRTVIDKKSKKCLLIDLSCPFVTRIEKKEEKYTNCSELKCEIPKSIVTEALFTWNDQNNMESVGYEMGKR